METLLKALACVLAVGATLGACSADWKDADACYRWSRAACERILRCGGTPSADCVEKSREACHETHDDQTNKSDYVDRLYECTETMDNEACESTSSALSSCGVRVTPAADAGTDGDVGTDADSGLDSLCTERYCPNDPARTSTAIASCRSRINSASCGSEWVAYYQCIRNNRVCDPATGTLNASATAMKCQTQASTAQSCGL